MKLERIHKNYVFTLKVMHLLVNICPIYLQTHYRLRVCFVNENALTFQISAFSFADILYLFSCVNGHELSIHLQLLAVGGLVCTHTMIVRIVSHVFFAAQTAEKI